MSYDRSRRRTADSRFFWRGASPVTLAFLPVVFLRTHRQECLCHGSTWPLETILFPSCVTPNCSRPLFSVLPQLRRPLGLRPRWRDRDALVFLAMVELRCRQN